MKHTLLCTTLAGFLLTVGCSYADFEKPIIRNYARDLFGGWERPEEVVWRGRLELEELAEAIEKWQEGAHVEEMEYSIGPGDEMDITVTVPTRLGPIAAVSQRVTSKGEIVCPLVGTVKAAGMTVDALQRSLTQMYADGYVKAPIVGVAITKYASKRYMVTGAVGKPGIYGLEENRTSVIEALLTAGGVLPEAGEYAVVTRVRAKGGKKEAQTVKVNIDAMLRHGVLSQNVWIGPGDVIHVPPETNPKQFFVLGFANAQGSFPMPRDRRIYLLDAIAAAGGISAVARPDMAELVRATRTGKKRYAVDLSKIVRGELKDIPLVPGDVLRVKTSWWRRYMEGLRYMFGFARAMPAAGGA